MRRGDAAKADSEYRTALRLDPSFVPAMVNLADLDRARGMDAQGAELLRKALSQPAELSDVDWADTTLEVVETKEQALVSKTARIVEEVALRKKGDDHVETIHEKLRRQEAEVQQLDATGKPRRA